MSTAQSVLLWVLLGFASLTVWVLYQLVRQQGRILLRLESIEQRLGGGAPAPVAARGLQVGTRVASFRLPALRGGEVALEDFRGQSVLLVNWSATCGFCDLIADDLAQLEDDFEEKGVQPVFLAFGAAEGLREFHDEHGLRYPVALREGAEDLEETFRNLGTPVAYLLDEEGRVAKPLAIGSDEVLTLARDAAAGRKKLKTERSLEQSRIVRDGLPAGTPAPTFTLPDVYGNTVSLEDYRGRQVLLVFSDPHCGPCMAMASELVKLERELRTRGGPAVVMVTRGDLEENRSKVEEHGFEFPVVMQDRWKLSKEYGIFATPVAFLIDEDGVIAQDVATGRDRILDLGREALTAR